MQKSAAELKDELIVWMQENLKRNVAADKARWAQREEERARREEERARREEEPDYRGMNGVCCK
jgi:hypothetical protein